MANSGSLAIALVALVGGLALGAFGVNMMLEEGSFFTTTASHERGGLLGTQQETTQSASINTPAWVGLLLALGGAGAVSFGARGLFIAFEGRGQI